MNSGNKNEGLDTIEETLKKNPLYHLSLSSIELFHSNFWAWLYEVSPGLAVKMFLGERGPDPLTGAGPARTREKHHIDLLLPVYGVYVAVENKIKDSPRPEQLRKYSETLERYYPGKPIHKVLVTLFDGYPKGVMQGWESVTYSDVSERLKKYVRSESRSVGGDVDKL